MGIKTTELTPEEKLVIKKLKELEKIWPKSLWLFAGESLCLMRTGENGERVMTDTGGVDQDYIVYHITEIPQDGGGW